jgi:hypothetical protein
MTTSNDLMLAVLAFDAYNRGSFSELKWGNAEDGGDGTYATVLLSAMLADLRRLAEQDT